MKALHPKLDLVVGLGLVNNAGVIGPFGAPNIYGLFKNWLLVILVLFTLDSMVWGLLIGWQRNMFSDT